MTGPEQVLIEDWCQQFPSHSIGDLAVRRRRRALRQRRRRARASTSSTTARPATRRTRAATRRPASAGTQTPPTAEGGALRAQDIRTARRPDRARRLDPAVDPDTGDGAAGQPAAPPAPTPTRGGSSPTGCATRSASRSGPAPTSCGSATSAGTLGGDRPDPQAARPARELRLALLRGHRRARRLRRARPEPVREPLRLRAPSRRRSSPTATATKVVPEETCPTGSSSISGLAFTPPGGTLPAGVRRRAVLRRLLAQLHLGDGARRRGAARPGADQAVPRPARRAGGPPVRPRRRPLLRRPRRRHGSGGSTTPPATRRRARWSAPRPTTGATPLHVDFSAAGSSDPDAAATRSPTPGTSTATAPTTTPPARPPSSPTRTRGQLPGRPEGDRQPRRVGHRRGGDHGRQHAARRRRSCRRAPASPGRSGDPIAFSGSATDAQDGDLAAQRRSAGRSRCSTARRTATRTPCTSFAGVGQRFVRRARPRVPVLPRAAADRHRQRRADRHPHVRLDPKTVDARRSPRARPGLTLALNGDERDDAVHATVIQGSVNSSARPTPQTLGARHVRLRLLVGRRRARARDHRERQPQLHGHLQPALAERCTLARLTLAAVLAIGCVGRRGRGAAADRGRRRSRHGGRPALAAADLVPRRPRRDVLAQVPNGPPGAARRAADGRSGAGWRRPAAGDDALRAAHVHGRAGADRAVPGPGPFVGNLMSARAQRRAVRRARRCSARGASARGVRLSVVDDRPVRAAADRHAAPAGRGAIRRVRAPDARATASPRWPTRSPRRPARPSTASAGATTRSTSAARTSTTGQAGEPSSASPPGPGAPGRATATCSPTGPTGRLLRAVARSSPRGRYGFLLDRDELAALAHGLRPPRRVAGRRRRARRSTTSSRPARAPRAIATLTAITGRQRVPPALGARADPRPAACASRRRRPATYRARSAEATCATSSATACRSTPTGSRAGSSSPRDDAARRHRAPARARHPARCSTSARSSARTRSAPTTRRPSTRRVAKGYVATHADGQPYVFASNFNARRGADRLHQPGRACAGGSAASARRSTSAPTASCRTSASRSCSTCASTTARPAPTMHNRCRSSTTARRARPSTATSAPPGPRRSSSSRAPATPARPGSAAYESAQLPGRRDDRLDRSSGLASLTTDMLNRGDRRRVRLHHRHRRLLRRRPVRSRRRRSSSCAGPSGRR